MTSIKKADPGQECGFSNTHLNSNKIHLSPTQRRIVKLLLENPEISYDVERKAYCRYAADNIQKIRGKGIEITTTMVDYVRQVDNKDVKVGKYSITPRSLERARLAVGEVKKCG